MCSGGRSRVTQVTWSSPRDEPAAARRRVRRHVLRRRQLRARPESDARSDSRRRSNARADAPPTANIPGLVYRSQDFSVGLHGLVPAGRRSLSYVTGSHSVKVGYQHTLMTDDRTWMTNDQNLTYRLNNGVPNQLTESISPWVNNARAAWDGALRPGPVDPRQADAAGRAALRSAVQLVPAADRKGRRASCPTPDRDSRDARRRQLQGRHAQDGRRLRRVRAAARTALKASLGKYLEGAGVTGNYANTNPTLRLPQTTSVFGTAGRDARVDRRESQLRARLRPAEPGRAGPARQRRRPVRRDVEHELRHGTC